MNINVVLNLYSEEIDNCINSINSLLRNSVVPNRIYIALHKQTFPNYEVDLPTNLYQFIMTSNKVIPYWVNSNSTLINRVFSILQYLSDDNFVISLNRAQIFSSDFVKNQINIFNKYQCSQKPIITYTTSHNIGTKISPLKLILCYKKMLNNDKKHIMTLTRELSFNDITSVISNSPISDSKTQTTQSMLRGFQEQLLRWKLTRANQSSSWN